MCWEFQLVQNARTARWDLRHEDKRDPMTDDVHAAQRQVSYSAHGTYLGLSLVCTPQSCLEICRGHRSAPARQADRPHADPLCRSRRAVARYSELRYLHSELCEQGCCERRAMTPVSAEEVLMRLVVVLLLERPKEWSRQLPKREEEGSHVDDS